MAQPRLTAATTLLHRVAYLQGFAVLFNLCLVKPNLSKKEGTSFFFKSLLWTVTDIFMVPSTQLLHVGFIDTEPCQATLDHWFQGGVP